MIALLESFSISNWYLYLPAALSIAFVLFFRVYASYFENRFKNMLDTGSLDEKTKEKIHDIALDCAVQYNFLSAVVLVIVSLIVLLATSNLHGVIAVIAVVMLVLFLVILLWIVQRDPGELTKRGFEFGIRSGPIKLDVAVISFNIILIWLIALSQ